MSHKTDKFTPWASISREERFFTAILFQDLLRNPTPFWQLLQSKVRELRHFSLAEVSFEVCFFRDAAHKGLIKRAPMREKQTFDFVLFLETGDIVIIEAKAHQAFITKQLNELIQARADILAASNIRQVYIMGLYSSKYHPMSSTLAAFTGSITWNDVASIVDYKSNAHHYLRADSIFHN
jgi:hypothetical protein